MKEINLVFDKLITCLAGNRFGRETYKNQIEKFLEEGGVRVLLPPNIEDIASSFYEGLFADLREKYGSEKAHELLSISSQNDYLNEKMNNIRETYGV